MTYFRFYGFSFCNWHTLNSLSKPMIEIFTSFSTVISIALPSFLPASIKNSFADAKLVLTAAYLQSEF